MQLCVYWEEKPPKQEGYNHLTFLKTTNGDVILFVIEGFKNGDWTLRQGESSRLMGVFPSKYEAQNHIEELLGIDTHPDLIGEDN